jgi:HK97 family phage portal protein
MPSWNDDGQYYITQPTDLERALKSRKEKFFFNLQAVKSDPQEIRYIPVPHREAGVYINEDIALKFSAVFRAVSFISQTIACLPWDVLLETPQKTTKLIAHPAWNVLRIRPNPEMSPETFRETLIAWAVSWGNGYAEIQRDEGGRVTALWPISPDRVEVIRDKESGQIWYEVSNYMGGTKYLRPENVFHLHGLGFDGLVGYSVISFAARSIALGMAAEEYGADFFANGAVSTGALKHPGTLSPKAQENLRKSYKSLMSGKGKRFDMPIFEEGMDWIDMMINPEDAQLLLTRQFQVVDIARWFGIPPHKLQDLSRGTFSNIEHQSIEVVNDALMPWIIRLEQEADYKLIRPGEKGVRTKLNVRGLLRGDDKSRAEYYQIMRNIGIYSTNDIRRLEDMDLVGAEGDELLVQLNQTTLKKLVAGDVPNQQKTDQKIAWQSYKMLFQHAYERILNRELSQFDRDKAKIKNSPEWFAGFFERQRARIEQDLEPLAFSFLLQMAPQIKLNGNLNGLLKNFIDWHIEGAKRYFVALLAGENEEYCLPERIKNGGDRLIENLAALSVNEKEK